MATNETIESFPIFNPDTATETPGHSAAVGRTVAAIGAPDSLGGAGSLAIYCYSDALNAWGYVGVLTGARTSGAEAVRSVGSSCLAFGDTIVVGAKGDEQTPGRVFVLKPSYGSWSYGSVAAMAELGRRDPAKGDGFGASLARCTDGEIDYIAVGAPNAAPPAGKPGIGQVFVFKGLESSKAPWSSSPILSPAGGAGDRFGETVALDFADGKVILVVGAPGANEQGAVFVAVAGEDGAFEFGDPLGPSFPGAAEDFKTTEFGASVALGGAVLAVGAPNDPNPAAQIESTGSVWVYEWVAGTFVAGTALYGPAQGAKFGASVAIGAADSGGSLFVGAPGSNAGEAFRYAAGKGGDGKVSFTPEGQYAPIIGKPGDRFGAAVSTSASPLGTWAFVGAPGNPKGGQDGGGYLFVEGEKKPVWMDPPDISVTQVRWGGQPLDNWKKYTPQITRYLS